MKSIMDPDAEPEFKEKWADFVKISPGLFFRAYKE
jgi:hypothetical protein